MEELKITAQEARKIAQLSIDSSNMYILSDIEKSINETCLKNQFCIYEYRHLSISVINHLKNRGFKVEDLGSQREGECFKISW
jgi:hypothetical protein